MLGALTTAVQAAAPEGTEPVELAPVLVTGTRLPPAVATSSPGTVLDSRYIRRRNAASLPELLRELPGAYVDQAGVPGGYSSLYLRGADPNHTTVLLDGVRVNDPTNTRGGGFDLSALDPYDLQRVELIPGAASSIYGSDAMAGVLSLTTGRAGPTGIRIGGGAGGRGYRRGYASLSGAADNLSAYLSGSALDDGRAADGGYRRLRTGSMTLRGERGRATWIAALRLQDRAGASFPEDSGGPVHAVRRSLEVRDSQSGLWSLEGAVSVGAGTVRGYANGYLNDEDTASPGVAPGPRDPFGLPRSRSATLYRRTTAGAAWTSEPARSVASLGAEFARERGDVRSMLFFGPAAVPADFSLTRQTRSLFGEARYRWTSSVTTELGVRADDVDRFGTRATGRLRATYLPPGTAAHIEATLGTGFKAPSFFALGNTIVGNPLLRPEESRTLEVAFATGGSTGQRVALFTTRYTNLIDFDPGPPPRLVNRSEIDMRGVEYAASIRSDGWTAHAAASALSYELPDGATPLRNRPRLKAAAGAVYGAGSPWSAGLHGTWRGKMFDSSIPTGGLHLQPDFVVDGSVSYTHRAARITLAIDNVFQRDYEQFIGFPAPGRRLRLELALPLLPSG